MAAMLLVLAACTSNSSQNNQNVNENTEKKEKPQTFCKYTQKMRDFGLKCGKTANIRAKEAHRTPNREVAMNTRTNRSGSGHFGGRR